MSATDQDIFAQYADEWWQEAGAFSPLHRLNPVRLSCIKQQLCAHFHRDIDDLHALAGLSILDAGCGGGLISEPLARLGAAVTGIDRDVGTIGYAREHAEQQGLDIDYQISELQALSTNTGYDVVLALELIEHVEDQCGFVRQLSGLCAPGGLVIVSTLNKTWQSWLLGIVGAEYVLRWVPQGTHDWQYFLRPSQCGQYMRQNNLTPKDIKGFFFNALKGEFEISDKDMKINYIITAQKESQSSGVRHTT